MIADTVAFLRARGPARGPRRRALLRRLPVRPGLRACAPCSPRFEAGAEVVALCDTNGGMLPDWVARDRRTRSAAPSDPTRSLGMHAHNDSGCAVANTLAAVEAGCAHVQGTRQRLRRAHRQRRPDRGRREPRAQARAAGAAAPTRAARRADRADPDRARHQRDHQHRPVRAPAVRRRQRVRAQGRPARVARSRSTRTSTSTPTRPSVGNDMRMLVSDMAGRASIELKGRELGFDLVGPAASCSPGSPTGSRTPRPTATPTTPPTRRSSCCCVEELDGQRPQYFRVESWRVIVERCRRARRRRRRPRRPSSCTRAASGCVSTGEGNGPVNALDHALRQALAPRLPGARGVRAHRLQGAHPRRDARHRRRHARAHRD